MDSFEVVYDEKKEEFLLFVNGVSSKTNHAEVVSDKLWKWLER